MLAMENSSRYNKAQAHSFLKQRRSGYEPSDTETEFQESPWPDLEKDHDQGDEVVIAEYLNASLGPSARNFSPLESDYNGTICTLESDYNLFSPLEASKPKPLSGNNNKSLHKPHIDDDDTGFYSNLASHLRRNRGASAVPEMKKDEANVENFSDQLGILNRIQTQKVPHKFMDTEEYQPCQEDLQQISRLAEKTNHSYRSVSTPKLRAREKKQSIRTVSSERRVARNPLPPIVGSLSQKRRESAQTRVATSDVNETVANVKLPKVTISDILTMQSTETIPLGDIFFSSDNTADNAALHNKGSEGSFIPKPAVVSGRNTIAQQRSRGITGFDQNDQAAAVIKIPLRRNGNGCSISSVNKQSGVKTINQISESRITDSSGMMSESFRKFTANSLRRQKDLWLSCARTGACMKSSKSSETREIDEASFIDKALVVENLSQFWADKHQPRSLSGFIYHKQQALHLKKLISHNSCPHIVLRGPSGSEKKALSMALLNEIFGASIWDVTNDLRYLYAQDTQPIQVAVRVASSPHHVELNLKSVAKNARHALMALIKEITSNQVPAPEFSDESSMANYKVILLYNIDKLEDNLQHLIRWIMECYTERCKIILCCEDDSDLLPSIKSRCELIIVDSPVTREITEVLIQIASKENFDLPLSFADKVAAKSKQNLRNAIMALEACKANNYPFVEEQPIPLGWEEILVELAEDILANPSSKILLFTRGNLQKLLLDFVHPKLILQKLVEQFLMGIEDSLKRELYYWHGYYEKRLPTGTGALLKLEEFVAKFISIYRKSFNGSHRARYK